MNILVIGKYGQLASSLREVAGEQADQMEKHFWYFAPSSELNVADRKSVQQLFARVCPDVVVNTAAYTQVDKAEQEVELAIAVNQLGCKNLAIACANLNIPLVHISTDYVFSGDHQSPYTPGEKTCPQNVYGLTKYLGEQEVMTYLSQFVIIRTAWVFSEYGNNFVRAMIKLARRKQEFNVVDDQVGNPTYAGDLARSIVEIIDAIDAGEKQWGIYHYNGSSSTSWYEFAREIFALAHQHSLIDQLPSISPIASEDYPTAAKRPTFSAMCNEKITRRWRVKPSNWKKGLMKVIDRERQDI
ncbi:dTDP-4-dehydrorhamnose reductase [Thalassotalea mangrovi]|uniref:dTDP-4-dehydrorhamnose reductase n=1 Tax=Thalassotalea mangrovi TaxID=2572245 RepID=A0A4U1B3W1_9GAMM|nr:dTDP-4-dehydrorhamnose reductase [Thalassotalea mangrovi]TKB44650.1 dTDP-4-dehydrorhamnose reductase [Thalassotalea mangrovi]